MTARTFVSDYRATWDQVIKGDAPVGDLDRFFHLPCLMVTVDSEVIEVRSQKEITEFNQSRLDAFRNGGVVRTALRGVDLQSQGPSLTLAIVNWELMRGDGSLERAWRHYYTIVGNNGSPTILVSAFQTGS